MKNAFTVDCGDFGNIGGHKGAQEAFEGGSEQAGRQGSEGQGLKVTILARHGGILAIPA